jgi:hypothetical protein
MKPAPRTRMLRIAAALALLAGVPACSVLTPHSDIEISKRYPVGNSPSEKCLDAAKRATYWCERGVPRSDTEAQGNCLKAQWDHAREC